MKKKGISPLIATVLIIGFTVALAAIIITWSTAFTKKMQATTEETANVQIVCATDVVFNIKNVCRSTIGYNILIQNDGKEDIKGWKIRVYQDESNVKPLPSTTAIPAFGINTITIPLGDVTGFTDVRKIEAFPIIERGGKDIICSQNVGAYGDASGNNMTIEC